MRNLANSLLDKTFFLRISAPSRPCPLRGSTLEHGHLGDGLTRAGRPCPTPRLAKTQRSGFLSRSAMLVSAAVCLLVLGAASPAWAQLTFEGAASVLNTGGLLGRPYDVAVDPSGNIYIADGGNDQILRVSPQGTASQVVISGLSPALGAPTALTVDGAGNLYITDFSPYRVVKVTPSGTGSTLDTGGYTLTNPQGVAVDASGNVFIADTGNSRIVKVPAVGAPSVLALTISGGTALYNPCGLAVDVSGNLYIADLGNSRIVVVPAGTTAGSALTFSGAALAHPLFAPVAVAVDALGVVYIADAWHRIITVFGGIGAEFSTGAVTLGFPYGLAVDTSGNLYIADYASDQIVVVATSAVGFGHAQFQNTTGITQNFQFTIGDSTTLGSVQVLTVGAANLDFTVVASGTSCMPGITRTTCNVIVQFLPTAPGLRRGAVVLYDDADPPNTLLTIPINGFADAPLAALAPNTAAVVSTGALTTGNPFQVAMDGAGNMFVGNYFEGSSNPSNVIEVMAGGSASNVNVGSPGGTPISGVTGIALDGAGNLFIADYMHDRIVVLTPGGASSVLTVGGVGWFAPTELAFDATGNFYIADYGNGQVIKVSSLVVAGTTSSGAGTILNTGSYTFSSGQLAGVAVGPDGTVYIAGGTGHVIQVTAAGVVSELAAAGITFSNPLGVAVDGMGNLYIVDQGAARVVRITTAGMASVISTNDQTRPTYGVTVDPLGNLYIPDWGNDRIVSVNVSSASLAFANTYQGSTSIDSPKTAIVTNLGNQALAFSASPTFTADFSFNSNDTNPCTSSTDQPVAFINGCHCVVQQSSISQKIQ